MKFKIESIEAGTLFKTSTSTEAIDILVNKNVISVNHSRIRTLADGVSYEHVGNPKEFSMTRADAKTSANHWGRGQAIETPSATCKWSAMSRLTAKAVRCVLGKCEAKNEADYQWTKAIDLGWTAEANKAKAEAEAENDKFLALGTHDRVAIKRRLNGDLIETHKFNTTRAQKRLLDNDVTVESLEARIAELEAKTTKTKTKTNK